MGSKLKTFIRRSCKCRPWSDLDRAFSSSGVTSGKATPDSLVDRGSAGALSSTFEAKCTAGVSGASAPGSAAAGSAGEPLWELAVSCVFAKQRSARLDHCGIALASCPRAATEGRAASKLSRLQGRALRGGRRQLRKERDAAVAPAPNSHSPGTTTTRSRAEGATSGAIPWEHATVGDGEVGGGSSGRNRGEGGSM